jgi:hypothetical protein
MSEDLWINNQSDDLASPPAARRPRVNTESARHIGCPLWWFRLIFPVVHGKNELAVALYLYRLRAVRRSRTIVVSNERLLAELGIDRYAKYRALRRLADAGVITIKRRNKRTLEIVFRRRRDL